MISTVQAQNLPRWQDAGARRRPGAPTRRCVCPRRSGGAQVSLTAAWQHVKHDGQQIGPIAEDWEDGWGCEV